MPDDALARPEHHRPAQRDEEYRRELRRLLAPTIRDAKTALLQLYAISQMAERPAVERFRAGRAFCEQGVQAVRAHVPSCTCSGEGRLDQLVALFVKAASGIAEAARPGADVAAAIRSAAEGVLRERVRVSEELLRTTEGNLESCEVPGMSLDVERNRHEGLVKYKLSVPSLGTEFDKVCLPEHVDHVMEALRDEITDYVLTTHLTPIETEVLQMLVDHGMVPFELEKTVVDIRHYVGGGNDGGPGSARGA